MFYLYRLCNTWLTDVKLQYVSMFALLQDDDELRISIFLLNVYISSKAREGCYDDSAFCGTRRSVMHAYALSTDKKLCSQQLIDNFWLILLTIENHVNNWTNQSSIDHLVDGRLTSSTITTIFTQLLHDDRATIDPYQHICRLLEGFVFMGKMSGHHANDRAYLNKLADDCINITERSLAVVIKPYGGWAKAIEICLTQQYHGSTSPPTMLTNVNHNYNICTHTHSTFPNYHISGS